ncbi:hypothetical protein [Bradyrhizobium sp.]|uniref:hypothetical protein n=1 Tax=Bradyrhizobium sp. TaxID=376 RepID=UPI004037C62F
MTPLQKLPPFLPKVIADIKARCACNRVVRPDLWVFHEEPFGPIIPNGQDGSKGAWVQQTIKVTCKCEREISFNLNPVTPKYPFFLYGDEANRISGQYAIDCYSLLGGTSGPIKDMSAELMEEKKRLLPDLDPSKWIVHCTKLLNGRERQKSPIFENLSREDVQTFIERCAAIIKTNKYAFVAAVFGFRKKHSDPKQDGISEKQARETMHTALLSQSIFQLTAQGLIPRIYLDATKPVRNLPHIEGWSRDTFLGSRHYLAYEYLSHGNNIAAPEFLKPGSHSLSELVDIHAFHLARSLLKRHNKEQPEVPMNKFGPCTYIAMVRGDYIDVQQADEVPARFIPL